MPVFEYKAKNQAGEVQEGLVEAASEEAVAVLLGDKNLSVVSITAKEEAGLGGISLTLTKVKTKDLVVFFRQLSVMVEANLPIVKAMRILTRQTDNRYLKAVIASIADEVEGGAKLSQAMSTYPEVFSNFYTNVVASGETSGRLSDVMNYLADQAEKDYDLKSKLQGEMIYPAFIFGMLGIVGFVIMTWVIPQITEMVTQSGAELPIATQILIAVSKFFGSYWWAVLLGLVGLGGGLFYFVKKTEGGKQMFDQLIVNIPIFGSVFRIIYIVRITQSFHTLLVGGVPVSQALETVKEVVDNVVYKAVIEQAIQDVDEGTSLAESLIVSKYIPNMVAQMISIGEETGKLDQILGRISDFYTREINNSLKNLTSLITPIIMVILAVAIGGFVAAVIMPMWQLSAAF